MRRDHRGRRTCSPRHINAIIMDDEDAGLLGLADQLGCQHLAADPVLTNGCRLANGTDRLSASSTEDEQLYSTTACSQDSDGDEAAGSTKLTASSCPISSSSSSPGHPDGAVDMLMLDEPTDLLHNDSCISFTSAVTDSSQLATDLTADSLTQDLFISESLLAEDDSVTSSELWPWGKSGSLISSSLLEPRENGINHSSESLVESEDEEEKLDASQTCQLRKVLREVVDTERCYLQDLEQVINVSIK